MSFNTSNIQADTFTGVYSISAPIHYVNGIPISKNGSNLKLGDATNTTVECLELECGTQITAPIVYTTQTNTDIIEANTTQNVSMPNNNLDMSNNQILNLSKLTLTDNAEGTENQVLSVDGAGNLVWKTDANDVANWSQYTSVSDMNFGNFSVESVNGLSANNLSATNNISTAYLTAEQLNISKQNELALVDLVGDMNIYDLSGNLLYNFDGVNNRINSDTGLNLNNFGTIKCAKLEPTFKPTRDFWVAPNGNNETGNGTQENPFLTIQYAINVCEAILDNEYKYIHLFGGTYTENLTITKKLYILGVNKSPFQDGSATVINGDILVNISTTGDLFGTGFFLDGVLLNGNLNNTSTGEAMINCNNLYVYSTTQNSLITMSPTNNSRLRFTNCIFNRVNNSSINAVLSFSGSFCQGLTLNNCIVYNSGNSDSSCMDLNNIGSVDNITMCKFESSSNSANVYGIVRVLGTSTPTLTFSNCAFFYSSSTNKSANANASGICFNNSANTVNLVLLYCSFFLLGTTNANYAVQDLNFGSPVPRVITLYYFNNASLSNAFSIRGSQGVSKFQLQVVS